MALNFLYLYVNNRHSPWKLFTAAFLVVILILSIAAAVVIPVVVLRHFNSYGRLTIYY